jgi:hypothetical protein
VKKYHLIQAIDILLNQISPQENISIETLQQLQDESKQYKQKFDELIHLYKAHTNEIEKTKKTEQAEDLEASTPLLEAELENLVNETQKNNTATNSYFSQDTIETMIATFFNGSTQLVRQITFINFLRKVSDQVFTIPSDELIVTALSLSTANAIPNAINYQAWIKPGVHAWTNRAIGFFNWALQKMPDTTGRDDELFEHIASAVMKNS